MKDESDKEVLAPVNLDSSFGGRFGSHPSSFPNGRALLRDLLSERNQHPERAAEIDNRLREAFERRVAILVLDMVGFSLMTVKYGIIHYLAMIHQMERAAHPAVEANGGRVIKQEADNLYAIFDLPSQALEAALDIFRAFEAVNSAVSTDRDIFGAIGIGYGDTLVIDDEDLFGCEMNLACKLGEDLAGKMEILLTAAAYDQLPQDRYVCAPAAFTIGGLEINCYRYERLLHPNLG